MGKIEWLRTIYKISTQKPCNKIITASLEVLQLESKNIQSSIKQIWDEKKWDVCSLYNMENSILHAVLHTILPSCINEKRCFSGP